MFHKFAIHEKHLQFKLYYSSNKAYTIIPPFPRAQGPPQFQETLVNLLKHFLHRVTRKNGAVIPRHDATNLSNRRFNDKSPLSSSTKVPIVPRRAWEQNRSIGSRVRRSKNEGSLLPNRGGGPLIGKPEETVKRAGGLILIEGYAAGNNRQLAEHQSPMRLGFADNRLSGGGKWRWGGKGFGTGAGE